MTGQRKVLFLVGTMNQLTMQHQVAKELPRDIESWFSPYYFVRSPFFWLAYRAGLLEHTFGQSIQQKLFSYLRQNQLMIDYRGKRGPYDLVVMGVDQFIPANIAGSHQKKLLIQEGLIWPQGWRHRLAGLPFVPRFVANSNAMGLSLDYEVFCVASEGYFEWFAETGIPRERMVVTGIPNFDRIAEDAAGRHFEHSNHLLFATHCLREDLEREARRALLLKAQALADGRKVIVKLHPREDHKRRRREVEKWLPEALVYEDGDTRAMIAQCDVFMTTFSSTVFDAMVLGKRIGHCDLDMERLWSVLPLQHGRAAKNIADIVARCVGV